MGLYVSHLDTVTIKQERSLYIYLLDYGWPEGNWETLFKRHFMKMADLAADAGAVVIGSPRGVHFSNDVLSWHRVGDLNADDVLPGLLITKTHPDYFAECRLDDGHRRPDLDRLLVIPLHHFCSDETGFVKSIEKIFDDLKSGLALREFSIARHDARINPSGNFGQRIADAIEIRPGAFGMSVDVKALLFGAEDSSGKT